MSHFVVLQNGEDLGRVSLAGELDRIVQTNGVGKVMFGLTKLRENAKGRCPACGFSVLLLEQSGLLGCPACYEVFKDEITSMLAPQDLVS